MRLNFVRRSLLEQLAMVDWIGTVIFVGSTTSFLVPLTWGGVQYPWDSWRTLVPLLIGAAGCVGFVFYEAYVPTIPLMPTVLFRNRTTVVSYISTLFVGLILWCILYYMPLYFEAVKGYSPIITGVALFPQTFTVSPSAIIAGIGITRTGRYRWAIWTGWVITTVGLGLFCVLQPGTSIPGWIFLNICGGIGMGFLLPSTASAVQASVASENVAIAIAMYSFFRSLGESLGVAIGGVIFQNRMYVLLSLSAGVVSHTRPTSSFPWPPTGSYILLLHIRGYPRRGKPHPPTLLSPMLPAFSNSPPPGKPTCSSIPPWRPTRRSGQPTPRASCRSSRRCPRAGTRTTSGRRTRTACASSGPCAARCRAWRCSSAC